MYPHGGPGMSYCHGCSVINRYNTSDEAQTIQEEIYVRIINEREYHLIIDYGLNKCLLYEYICADPTRWSNRKELLATDHIIQCTPQTVENKIKTYLLFL